MRPSQNAAAPELPGDALVIGGGIAGLVAARELALSGHRVTLVEAAESVGGLVGSHEVDGLDLDAGAESFATRTTAVARLARELGLDVVQPSGAPSWLHAGPGVDVPSPRGGSLGIPADPLAPEVVRAVGEAAARRAAEDLETPVDPALLQGPVTLGTLVRERMGDAILQTLVRPVVAGVHSTDPDTTEADAVAPGLRAALAEEGSLARAAARLRSAAPAGSAVAGLSGGMHTLAQALERDLRERGVEVLTGRRATAVEHRPGARKRPPWTVSTEAADPTGPSESTDRGDGPRNPRTAEQPTTLRAERLIVATDGPTAVRLLATAVPGLAGEEPAAGAPIALVTLVVDSPDLDSAPRGTGVLVAPEATDVQAKALTHATAKWPWLQAEAGPGRHVLRLSYGRADDEGAAAADRSDDDLTAQALQDAAVLLGTPLDSRDVLGSDVVRHRSGLPLNTPGTRERLQRIDAQVGAVPDLDIVGAWRAGTGLSAIVEATRTALELRAS